MGNEKSSSTVVYAALIGNLLVAATKFIAAAVSGSSSMLSEAFHSLVDTVNEVLLLYGLRQARRAPDPHHPLGYGRELYFWSFVVAVLLFALGAGLSIYEGVQHIVDPEPIENVLVVYIVLGLSAVFEGYSWRVALKAFREAKGELGYWEAVRRSKDPPTFMVLFEDSAALVGIALAALGTFASTTWSMPELDGVASICIGVLLAGTSTLLARETKGLLIGERADPRMTAAIKVIAESEPGVLGANGLFTVQLAPHQVVVSLSLEFDDDLRTPDIEAAVTGIERRVKKDHPDVMAIFVKPQTRGEHARNELIARPETRVE